MTRATLLATTTAILLPVTGALAQSVDTDAGVGVETSGNEAAASAGATAEGETRTDTTEDLVDSATSAAEDAVEQAGETAEDVGDAVTSTAEDAAEAVSPGAQTTAEGGVTAQAGTMTVGDITGMDVVDATGEVIGSVDMVVEQVDGKAAVIGIGGFLGIGAHQVAIPTAELSMSTEGRLQLAGQTEEELRQRPEFDAADAAILDANVELPDVG